MHLENCPSKLLEISDQKTRALLAAPLMRAES